MKKTLLAVAVATISMSSVAATTDNFDVYGAIEVGGYFSQEDVLQEDQGLDYVTDTNATIGLSYDDGSFIGAVELDGAIQEGVTGFGVVLDKAWVGYRGTINSTTITTKAGLHDSVFDDHSGLGDVAIEFGNGAFETGGASDDIDGVTVEATNGGLYVGATLVSDLFVNLDSWNGAIEYTTGNLTVGGAYARVDGTFDLSGFQETSSWNVGATYSVDGFTFGALHNQHDDDVDSHNDVNNTQVGVSGTFDKLTVATTGTYYKNPQSDVVEDGMKVTLGATYAFSDEVMALVDLEHDFEGDTRGFAKAIYTF